jgi:predicted nucleic acid-binding protein
MIGADTTFLIQLEVRETPQHVAAHRLLQREILDPNIKLALAPQVLAEFLHIATDPRRFQHPLTMAQALTKIQFWWNAIQVERVFPTAASTDLFMQWMSLHHLGRKRLLDTQLGAIFRTRGVQRVITSNEADFRVLGLQTLTP